MQASRCSSTPFPVDAHFPGDIVRTSDAFKRWVRWMTVHLK